MRIFVYRGEHLDFSEKIDYIRVQNFLLLRRRTMRLIVLTLSILSALLFSNADIKASSDDSGSMGVSTQKIVLVK